MASLEAKSSYKLDQAQHGRFISYFKSLPNVSDVCFRFFDHGEYFSVHGKSALVVAKEYFKTTTRLKYIGSEKLETVNLSQHNFEAVAKFLLLVCNYRIEIYKCEKSKSQKTWNLNCKASPGNLSQVEELLFNSPETAATSSSIITIKYCAASNGQFEVGLGLVDAVQKEIMFSNFHDNEIFSNLESIIIQIGAKECLLSKLDGNSESQKLCGVLKRSGILITEHPKKSFDAKDIEQDLNRLLRKNKKTGSTEYNGLMKSLMESKLASRCLSAIINYLELTNKEDHFDQYSLRAHKLGQYMRLDRAAYKALSLFSDDFGNSRSSVPDSLYKLLNHCKTSQGKRLLSQWIKQPLLDKNLVQERLDIVETFINNDALCQMIAQQYLRNMADLERLSKKFCNRKATLQDCYKVYQTAKTLPLLCECFEEHGSENDTLLREIFTTRFHESSHEFTKFVQMVETTLDMDKIAQLEFRVKSTFDPELERLNDQMEEAMADMEEEFASASLDLGLERGKVMKLESTSQHGYFFRITCKQEKMIRGNRRFIQLDTTKAGVRFVTKKLQTLNAKYQECSDMFLQQQSAIVTEILGIASGYVYPMSALGRLTAKLDVLISFAKASVSSPVPFVKPTIVSGETEGSEACIDLKQCRHPCLEVQEDVSFIPNDVKLVRNQESFVIITGPNMGGKSTYILQVGVAVLMAQIGCFVPCSEAKLSLVDAILARVGAGDSQVQGVSTFMSEMLEAASILRSATINSLVLIDELGRGTSTYDGFGLAWAISHRISKEIGSWCLFATHFHELTALADDVPNVANYHVTALAGNVNQQNTLTMLYQVKPGVCDQSFGIHVAECVEFPARVVEAAKRKAIELEDCYITLPDEKSQDGRTIASKKRKIKHDGEEIISSFLRELEGINNTSNFDEKLTELKRNVVRQNNIYVNEFLTRTGIDVRAYMEG